jgi:hypothetical protein
VCYALFFLLLVYLQINTWAFPYWPDYHPETLILAQDAVEGQYGSRDDNQVNMEMPMYQTIYYILPTSRKETPILAETKSRPMLARAKMGLDMEMIL